MNMTLEIVKKAYALEHPNLSIEECIDSLSKYFGMCYTENRNRFEVGKSSGKMWWIKADLETKDYNVYKHCFDAYVADGSIAVAKQIYKNPAAPIAYTISNIDTGVFFRKAFEANVVKVMLSTTKNAFGMHEIRVYMME